MLTFIVYTSKISSDILYVYNFIPFENYNKYMQSQEPQKSSNELQGVQKIKLQLATNRQQLILSIYNTYFKQIKFTQIDYAAGQIPEGMLDFTQHKQLMEYVAFIEGCLIWTEKGYDTLYYSLLKGVKNQSNQWSFRNICADLLLTMNGQNDKAYNFKKLTLKSMTQDLEKQKKDKKQVQNKFQSHQDLSYSKDKNQVLDLERQLLLNSAVTMKFKKTTSCYEYRIKLVQLILLREKTLNQNNTRQFIIKFHQQEHTKIKKIIERFPRNYFCWAYRLRLFKLFIQIENSYEINESEILMVHQILGKNTNDYSALSYYRFLIRNCQSKEYYGNIINLIMQKCDNLLQFCKIAYDSEENYKYFIEFIIQVKQRSKLLLIKDK